jgi:hypothetical protein
MTARFPEVWEILFGLKMFAEMQGFGGFAVRGEFVTGRRDVRENFFFLP